jgi:hypothetical protein
MHQLLGMLRLLWQHPVQLNRIVGLGTDAWPCFAALIGTWIMPERYKARSDSSIFSHRFRLTAMKNYPVVPLQCVNQTISEPCRLEGSFAGKNCKLVSVSVTKPKHRGFFILTPTQYCGPACQKHYRSSHKVECRDPLNKRSLIPEWDCTNRTPALGDWWSSSKSAQSLRI